VLQYHSHAGSADFSRSLYDRHKEAVEAYLRDQVVPNVLAKREYFLLKVSAANRKHAAPKNCSWLL
jgi:hypothetical protein